MVDARRTRLADTTIQHGCQTTTTTTTTQATSAKKKRRKATQACITAKCLSYKRVIALRQSVMPLNPEESSSSIHKCLLVVRHLRPPNLFFQFSSSFNTLGSASASASASACVFVFVLLIHGSCWFTSKWATKRSNSTCTKSLSLVTMLSVKRMSTHRQLHPDAAVASSRTQPSIMSLTHLLSISYSSIIKRYCEGYFTPNYKLTIGVDFAVKVVEWDEQTSVSLQVSTTSIPTPLQRCCCCCCCCCCAPIIIIVSIVVVDAVVVGIYRC
jgi:hypothetical protein